MITITVDRQAVNLAALHDTLKAAIGADYLGASRTPTQVQVHLQASATATAQQQAAQLATAHDASQLSNRQQAALARRQALATARANQSNQLDLSDYDYADGIIRQLAQKIAWLELEISDLRGEG